MSMYDHCIYFNLSALSRKIAKIWEEEFGALGLSPSHGYVLLAIFEKPEISHKELCELMEMDPSTITRFLDKLERQGWVLKSNKGKGAVFRLTPRGRAVGPKIARLMDRLFEKMQNRFGPRDFAETVKRLQKARRSLD